MKNVEVIQVIRTTLSVRGKGTEESLKRAIVEYWDMDGNLLWEYDPCPNGVSEE